MKEIKNNQAIEELNHFNKEVKKMLGETRYNEINERYVKNEKR